jgi:LacI family transcriptional regulator
LVELHGYPNIGFVQVQTDFQKEARMAVEHFFDNGLRHFAFFSFGSAWIVKFHHEAFVQAVNNLGYDCHCYQPPPSNGCSPVWHESERPGVIRWLRSLPRPIGIFTPGDVHAMLLSDLCRTIDIPVPEEMAILGLGNDSLICQTVHPTLSSIDLAVQRVGYEAASQLDRMMAGKKDTDIIYVEPSHVAIRQSTDVIAVDDADVAQALHYIRQWACKGIEVSDVVERVGLSRRTLEMRFNRLLGRSPKAEISRIRIEHAKMLLVQTDQTSKRIARNSGFSSLEYFTTAFHRIVGVKPQVYRRMRRIACDFGKTE